jgi:hypothetical protein
MVGGLPAGLGLFNQVEILGPGWQTLVAFVEKTAVVAE